MSGICGMSGNGSSTNVRRGPATKSDDFLEKFQGGGGGEGSFSIQKSMLQILETLNRAF